MKINDYKVKHIEENNILDNKDNSGSSAFSNSEDRISKEMSEAIFNEWVHTEKDLDVIAEELDMPTDLMEKILRFQIFLNSLESIGDDDTDCVDDMPDCINKKSKLPVSIFGMDREIVKDASARHMHIVSCLKKHEDNLDKIEIDIITESLEAFFDSESKAISDDNFELIRSRSWPRRVRTLLSLDCREWAERLVGVVDIGKYTLLIERIKRNESLKNVVLKFMKLETEYYKSMELHDVFDSFDIQDMERYFSYLRVIKSIEDEIDIQNYSIEDDSVEGMCKEFILRWTPKSIAEYLREKIVGQNEAINVAALSFYNHIKRVAFLSELKTNNIRGKQNVLFIGPSGCGKSEIFRLLQRISPVHIAIEDASSLTAEGFSGVSKSELLENLCVKLGPSVESSIIVFDEADKLCRPQFDGAGSNISVDMQAQLLKLLEDGELVLGKNRRISTGNIMIVLLGAFSEIDFEEKQSKVCGFKFDSNRNSENDVSKTVKVKESLKQYGVLPELLGRITYTVRLNQLDDNDYKKIISKNVISAISDFYGFHNDIVLEIEDSAIDEMIIQAKECHLGARELQNIMYSVVGEKAMLLDDNKHIHITKNDVMKY